MSGGRCTGNTLRGFVVVELVDYGMVLAEVAVHAKGGSVWANPPARPVIQNGQQLRTADGKWAYGKFLTFVTSDDRKRFSDEVIAALRKSFPEALKV